VSSVAPVLLFGLSGILLGGAYSIRKQGAGLAPVVILLVFSLLALVSGGYYLFAKD
jgi:hypothetical protein